METKKCENCKKELRGRDQKRFCSRSCANTVLKTKRRTKKCLNCNKLLTTNQRLNEYCSNKCQQSYKRLQKAEQWLSGDWDGAVSNKVLSKIIRNYLLEQANHKCSKCGWGEKNPYSDTIPLEIEHKNGNGFDHRPDNLEVLCPNCHSLTKTYRGLNRGKGKRELLKYYIKGENGKTI